MSNTISQIVEYMTARPWAMERQTLGQLCHVLERHTAGIRLDSDEIERITAGRHGKEKTAVEYRVTGAGVAVLPVTGIIAKHARMVNGTSQPRGTSIEVLSEQLARAVNDPEVGSILLQIESPGGYINGLADFAAEVYAAGMEKPVTAYADDMAASAAYWIGSQATRFYANQSAEVGCIGVYSVLVDSSERAAAEGLRFVILRSGENKGVGEPGVAITPDQEAVELGLVMDHFEMFLSSILRGRRDAGLDEKTLRTLADGRSYIAAKAARSKLIDGVKTWQQVLRAAARTPKREPNEATAAAAAEPIIIETRKDETMADKETKQAAAETTEKTLAPDAVAVAAERERIKAITAALNDEDLAGIRGMAIDDGLSVDAAKALAFDQMKVNQAARTQAMQSQIDDLQKRLGLAGKGGLDVPAGEAVDKNEDKSAAPPAGDDGQAQTYLAAVEQWQAKGKSLGEASRLAAAKYPNSYKQYRIEAR